MRILRSFTHLPKAVALMCITAILLGCGTVAPASDEAPRRMSHKPLT